MQQLRKRNKFGNKKEQNVCVGCVLPDKFKILIKTSTGLKGTFVDLDIIEIKENRT